MMTSRLLRPVLGRPSSPSTRLRRMRIRRLLKVDVAAAGRDRLRRPCSRPEAQDQAGRRAARTRRGRGRHIGTRAGASAEDALEGALHRAFLRLPLTHGSARRLLSPRADDRAQSTIGRDRALALAADRQAPPPRDVPREIPMKARVLLLAFAVGCSTSRLAATAREPVGCCCTYGDCRERYTHEECASEGEFQGWTYTWHTGDCSAQDVYPASDHGPSSR